MPLSFPFWVVLSPLTDTPVPGECQSDFATAFSTTDDLRQFLGSRKSSGSGSVRLVGRESLMLLIADLHQRGAKGLCLDPEGDGSGGTEIPLSELMKLT